MYLTFLSLVFHLGACRISCASLQAITPLETHVGILKLAHYTTGLIDGIFYGGVDVCYLRISHSREIPLANIDHDGCLINAEATVTLRNATREELSHFPTVFMNQNPATVVLIESVLGIPTSALLSSIYGGHDHTAININMQLGRIKAALPEGSTDALRSTALSKTGTLRWLVVGSTLTDDSSIYNVFPDEGTLEELMFNAHNGVGVSYAATSYNTLSITAANTDYVIVSIPKSKQDYETATPCNQVSFYYNDILPRLPVRAADYDMITIIWPSPVVCAVIGQAYVEDTLTFINQNPWTSTITHELGHNMGLRHSGQDWNNVGFDTPPSTVVFILSLLWLNWLPNL